MNIRAATYITLALFVTGLTGAALAEDIDIYSYPPAAGAQADVLIILDNSANWSASIPVNCSYDDGSGAPRAINPNSEQGTKMAIEKCALYNLIDALPSGTLNVGLMLFNEPPNSNSGGYPRVAIARMDDAGKAALKTTIRNLGINSDKGSGPAFAKSLYEAYLYLTQAVPYRGTVGAKWDASAVASGKYRLPDAASCAKHVIFIANGGAGDNTNNEAKALLAAAGGDITQIQYPGSLVSNSDEANWSDEFSRFMRTKGIVTHAVAVTGASSDGLYPNFIENIADKGGGLYKAASNAQDLKDALESIFAKIQSISSVFASASLPISVNTRGTYLNQVFMGMFLPDEKASPRWLGNIKQYQFSYNPVTQSLVLADSQGNDAVAISGGFIDNEAVSFWTHSSTFWTNFPSGIGLSSDSPDGEIVAKGGAGQLLRESYSSNASGRKIYTCIGCSSSAVTLSSTAAANFVTTNTGITNAMVGMSTTTDRDKLIEWVRGSNNKPTEEIGPDAAVVRASIHGDILHSRPSVVNYGGSRGVVVYYGANDGMLHAINGNKTGSRAGEHLWSFIAPEHFSKLKRIYDNTPLVDFPNLSTTQPVAPRDYFVDGPLSVYQKVDGDGEVERVYLYAGMRRGGRFIYAFDVTDPDTPAFLWKKTSGDISVLGQTWSEARVIKVKGYSVAGEDRPVIIMGAGYDSAAEDVEPAGGVTMGNAILILDAFSGTVLANFSTTRPVPADVSVVDSDFDGYVDRAYAVDLGGNIYRIDLETPTTTGVSAWKMTLFATFASSPGKKFFFPPDVVLTKNYAALLVGSGDREKPLSTNTQDYFYVALDYGVGKSSLAADFQPITFGDLAAQDQFTAGGKGCYLQLGWEKDSEGVLQHVRPGEKVVNAPLTIGGVTRFSTNRPTPNASEACSANLGEARAYSFPLICKTATSSKLEGGGLPPSAVAGIVEVSYVDPTTGETVTKRVPFIIGGEENSKKSPIEASRVKIPVPPQRSKIFWYTETER